MLIWKAKDIGYPGPGKLLGRSALRCLVTIESFICFSGNQNTQLVVSLSTDRSSCLPPDPSSMLLLPIQPSSILKRWGLRVKCFLSLLQRDSGQLRETA